MKTKNVLLAVFLCVTLIMSSSLFAFADTTETVINEVSIPISREDVENGIVQYGITILEDGSMVTNPISTRDFDFGIAESYDGFLTVHAWTGTRLTYALSLRSTGSTMLAHSGTISTYEVEFMAIPGAQIDSDNFNITSETPTTYLSRTAQIFTEAEGDVFIRLTNLLVNRTTDGLLSIPSTPYKKHYRDDY